MSEARRARARRRALHVRHLEDDTVARNETFGRATLGVFFYDSLVVVEKRPGEPPVQHSVGREGA